MTETALATTTAAPAIQISAVSKWFGPTQVLRDIDLSVERGEVVCMIGPSGAGKSTLLRCMNHLETVDRGQVRLNGELIGYREHRGELVELKPSLVAKQRDQVGMVFQHFNLFPHLTVMQNLIEAPMHLKRLRREEARRRAMPILERVGLGHKADAYPQDLSGGQQQRVAIARALAMEPQIMLFDEPTSALDPELVGEVLSVMRGLAHDGITMVVVTHEIAFAREVADRVVFMVDGAIVEQGPAREVLDNPTHPRTAEFLEAVL